MRRIIIFCAAVLIIFSSLSAQSITITNPGAGWGWLMGETRDIQWSVSGEMDTSVKIHLIKSDDRSFVLEISGRTSNDGRYSWTIPRDLNARDYRIKIRTLDDLVSHESHFFSINALPPTPVTIKSPHANVDYENMVMITWEGNEPYLNEIRLELYNEAGTAKITDIVESLPRQNIHGGQYRWVRPISVREGSYLIRLSSLDRSFHVDGHVFGFQPYPDPYITFLNPKKGMIFSPGKLLKINWKKVGSHIFIRRVRIEIFSTGKLKNSVRVIARNAANNGSYSWRIPLGYASNTYRIKISSTLMKGSVLGISKNFIIGNPGKIKR